MQDAGGVLRPPVQKLAASIWFCPMGQNRQSSPISSTIHEKSELLPCGGWVRVSCFHWKCFLLTPAPSLPERECRRFYFVGRNEWIFESLCQAAIGRTGLLCRLFSVAEHRHPRFAAYGAGVQHEVIAAVLDSVDLRRRQGFDLFNEVGVENAFHIRKDDGITP